MARKVSQKQPKLRGPTELRLGVGRRARDVRLARGLLQDEVAAAAGVSRQTVMRFERGDSIAFEAVVRIAFVLRADDGFDALFAPVDTRSLDELLLAERKPKRVRARKKS